MQLIIDIIGGLCSKLYESYKLNKRATLTRQKTADSPIDRNELENTLDKGDL